MGFFVKTMCPVCYEIHWKYYNSRLFDPNDVITVCRCGCAYDNRLCLIDIEPEEENSD